MKAMLDFLGAAVGAAVRNSTGIGISLWLLAGLVAGTCIRKETSGGESYGGHTPALPENPRADRETP